MAIRIKKATEHAETNMTVRAYIEKIEIGEITFDIDIQRAYVWKDVEQKSGLIQSLIVNDIIPPFIFNKVDGVFEGMDSKQRSYTIHKFLKDEFTLKGVMPIEVINENGELEEYDINGLKYSQLPECFQNAIKDYNLSIWYLTDADQVLYIVFFIKERENKRVSKKKNIVIREDDVKNYLQSAT